MADVLAARRDAIAAHRSQLSPTDGLREIRSLTDRPSPQLVGIPGRWWAMPFASSSSTSN